MGGGAGRKIRSRDPGRADESGKARRHDEDRPALIVAINAEPIDSGTAHFGPSNLEFTSIDVGNKTVNLIPAEARARFNIRFNDTRTREELRTLIEARAAKAAGNLIRSQIEWEPS